MPKTSVILVDDNPLFLEQTRALLSRVNDIDVVGSAGSAAEAIALVERLQPCVVLMDIALPDLNGIEVTRQLKCLPNPPAVLMLTLYDDPAYRAAAAAAGAEGFLSKSDLPIQLLGSLRRVCGRAGRSAAPKRGEA